MTYAYRQFFMDHKGDIEAQCTTNKERLTNEMGAIRDAILASQGTEETHDGKMVDEEELLHHMCRGWETVQKLDGGRFRIRRKD